MAITKRTAGDHERYYPLGDRFIIHISLLSRGGIAWSVSPKGDDTVIIATGRAGSLLEARKKARQAAGASLRRMKAQQKSAFRDVLKKTQGEPRMWLARSSGFRKGARAEYE